MLETLEINPKSSPRASVIWLHGLGASGYDFFDTVPMLNLSQDLGVRFIFPHAPVRPVKRCGGMEVRAWFDIDVVDKYAKVDEQGIRESEDQISQLIKKEREKNIASGKIVLIGFSQGGAMVLQCGLRYPEKLAGILSLSAWLPLAQTVALEKSESNMKTPISIMHGINDDVVPFEFAKEGYDYLKKLGYEAELTSYPMRHEVCSSQISAIGKWLNNILA